MLIITLGIVLFFIILILGLIKVMKEKMVYVEQLLDENELVREFLSLKQNGGTIREYLDKLCYKTVAIWGIDRLGKLILHELLDEKINIVYCIDDTICNHYDLSVDVYYPLEKMPPVDAIICIFPLPERWKIVSNAWGCPVINLIDVLKESKK